MQRVLIVSTYSNRLRGEIFGWIYEDGDQVLNTVRRLGKYDRTDIPVGMISSGMISGGLSKLSYPTVLHAIGDGWKLLAPPQEYKEGGKTCYEWWLVREGIVKG